MKKQTTDVRILLDALKEIVRLDYEEQVREGENGDWDGSSTYTGIKRMLYGLWHEGKNEKGENMVMHMAYQARQAYKQLSILVHNKGVQEPVIKFPEFVIYDEF